MSALAVAPSRSRFPPRTQIVPSATPSSGIFLARLNPTGQILWMNEAARRAWGPAKELVSALTAWHPQKALLAFPWGKQWLLVGAVAGKSPAHLDRRAARLNGQLMEIARRLGSSNQRLAEAREVVEERRRRGAETKARVWAGASFVQAMEEERGCIARELHDNAGQSLAGVLLNLELVERLLDSARAEALARLERSKKLASLALEQIRRTSRDLHPPEWSGLDFRAAVELLVETMAVRSRMRVETSDIEVPPTLSTALKTTLYRVIQETLVNALRHSGASCVKIAVSAEAGQVRLVIEDDGQGFDPSSLAAQGTGIGLKSLRRRVEELGGRLEISAAPGRGARFAALVPIGEPVNGQPL